MELKEQFPSKKSIDELVSNFNKYNIKCKNNLFNNDIKKYNINFKAMEETRDFIKFYKYTDNCEFNIPSLVKDLERCMLYTNTRKLESLNLNKANNGDKN